MVEFISNLVNNNLLATILMALVPMIELKGAIVFARGVGFGFFEALGLSFLGSTVVFIPIFFLLIPILNLLKKIKFVNKFAEKIEEYFNGKAQDALKKAKNGKKHRTESFYKMLGVFIFVAIPLPLTGVWTGTAIAVFLNMKFKDVVLPVMIGNLVAGLIISVLAQICMTLWSIAVLDYILYALFALAVVLLVITIVKVATTKKHKTEEVKEVEE